MNVRVKEADRQFCVQHLNRTGALGENVSAPTTQAHGKVNNGQALAQENFKSTRFRHLKARAFKSFRANIPRIGHSSST